MLERTIVRIITGIWKLLIAPDIFGVLLPSHWLEALQPTAFTNIMHIVEVLSHYPSSLPPSLPPFSPPFLPLQTHHVYIYRCVTSVRGKKHFGVWFHLHSTLSSIHTDAKRTELSATSVRQYRNCPFVPTVVS